MIKTFGIDFRLNEWIMNNKIKHCSIARNSSKINHINGHMNIDLFKIHRYVFEKKLQYVSM